MSWESSIKLVHVPGYTLSNGSELYFKSSKERDEFFNQHTLGEYTYENTSYIRLGSGSVRIKGNADKISYEGVNFIVFKNSNFGDRLFYANVIGEPVYVSPNVTELNYAMNDWITYFDVLDLSKPSYVARRTFTSKDSDQQITQLPYEDIDIGEDYLVSDSLFDWNGSDGSWEDNQFYFLLMTKPLTPTGSTHIITTGAKNVKIVKDNKQSQIQVFNGVNSVLYGYVMNFKCLNGLIGKGIFLSDCDLVNSLQMVLLLPFGKDIFPTGLSDIHSQITTSSNPNVGQSLPNGSLCYDQQKFGNLFKKVSLDGFGGHLNDYINRVISGNMESSYNNNLNTSGIGRYLYRYPYSLIHVYDFYNQPLTLKPETINRDTPLKIFKEKKINILKYGSVGQNPTLVYGIEGYGNIGTNTVYNNLVYSDSSSIYNLSNIQLMTVSSVLSLPIISNYLSTFLQSNQNQINATRLNLRDSLQTQINNAAASLQATALSIALNQRAAEIQANAQAQNANMQAAQYFNATNKNIGVQAQGMANEVSMINAQTGASAINSVVASIGAGAAGNLGQFAENLSQGVTGIALGSKKAMLQTQLNNMITSTNIQNNQSLYTTNVAMAENSRNAAIKSAELATRAASAQANASYANTMRSANTAYTTAIRSLNARLQDAKNVPDTVQSMGNNGSIFNMLTNRDTINIATKTLVPEVMERLVDYFTRVGFLTNRNEKISELITKYGDIPGFYIQTVNANISGKVPTEALKNIIAMFNSGVHFWKPDKYLQYDEMRGV